MSKLAIEWYSADLSTGYEPGKFAKFLVVELEEQNGVYELLPILV